MPVGHLLSLGLALVLAGFLVTFIAVLMFTLSGRGGKTGSGRGGAVILLGPIPIVIGSDPAAAKTLILLAITLLAAAVIFFLILGGV